MGSGELDCTKKFPEKQEETFLKKYFEADVFGELSLLYNTPRAASIRAVEKSQLFSLDRDTFNNIVRQSTMKKREKYENYLANMDLLKELDPYERNKLADVLVAQVFKKGEEIVREGEEGDKFYLILSGEAVAVKGRRNDEKVVF